MREMELWPDEYLFLFSHMRSYSTVLSHVLGSHPQIAGYNETHLKYRHRSDLWRLRWRVARATGSWPRGRYLLDKLLHNFMFVPKELRHSGRLRALLFIRRPEAALRSVLRMGNMYPEKRWYSSAPRVAEYYCERVTWLTAVGVHLKDRAFVFEAEAIINDTNLLLQHLTGYLALRVPLSPNYQLRKFSGMAGHGDASTRLKSGVIVSDQESAGDPEPPVDPALIERCTRVYLTAMTTLHDWCPSHKTARRGGAARPQPLVA